MPSIQQSIKNLCGHHSLINLRVCSVECCGWLELSGFGLKLIKTDESHKYIPNPDILKDLDKVVDSDTGFVQPQDTKIEGDTVMTVFCTLAGRQVGVYEKELLNRGFIALPNWTNPNTDHVIHAYVFIPHELKI